MKRILILIIGLIGVAYGQSSPTSSKTRFVNGLYLGTKLDSYFAAADSNALYWRADSVVMAKYKGTARALAFAVSGGYLPILDTATMLSKYFRTTTQLNDTTFVINRPDATADTIQLSFLVPDTTGKLSIIDTSAMLAPYRRTSTKITNSDLANSTISGIALGSNLNNLTAGNGLSGTAYNGGTAYTWQVDTSTISTKANVTGALVGYTTVSRFTDSLTNVQTRIQTKQPLGNYLTFADSSTILAGRWLPNRSADSIAVIRALANTKLNISDTALMLTPFVQYSDTANQMSGYLRKNFALLLQDTAAMLSNRLRISDTLTMLSNRLKISDTSNMLSPYARTANLPSLAPYLLKADSLSGGYTTWLLTKKKIDSIGALKVNYTDTAAIVANRLKISDTATMLLPFVQYSDTASIVSGYVRSLRFTDSLNNVQTRIQTKLAIADTATMLSGYTRITRFTDSLTAVQARIQTKQPLGNYITFADSTTILAGRWLPNRSADSIAVIRALANSKGTGSVTSVATGVGLSGGTITTSGTISADTTTLSTRAYVTGTLVGYTTVSRFTDSLTNVQSRIQTKQPLGAYITLADSTTILAGRWLPNRSADSIAVIRALANTKGVGTVTSVTASAPLSSSGGTTPNITISQATTSTNGFLTSTDWNTFNDKASTASVALKLNISDTAAMMSKSFRTTTQVNDTTFTINRPDGTKDTIALSVQVPSTSQLVYNTALTTDADYSLGLSDTYVQLVSTSTPRTLTLPAASTCLGRVVILNSKVGGGSGWTSTQTIYTTYPTTGGVTSLNGSVDTIISNGTNWVFLTRY